MEDSREVQRRAQRLRRRLVATLDRAGALPDPAWRAAFAAVPRHLFVPAFHQLAGPLVARDDPDPAVRERWLTAVHTDDALVTRRAHNGEPTSSSSQPSLMAQMLHALDVREGTSVLEVGTGTGYNAALLCHRLGDARVTSVDVSAELVETARARLARLGYRPRLATGDGALGWPPGAPYDRLIATCRVTAVPPAWLEQLAEGGVIIAPLGVGLARVERTGPTSGAGRFLGPAYFMPLRPPSPATPAEPPPPSPGAAETTRRPTELTAAQATQQGLGFLLSVIEPNLTIVEDDTPRLHTPDGSAAELHEDGTVTESGPRRLWSVLEAVHRSYAAAGRPGMADCGLSVGGPGARRQRLWLGGPDGPSWPLPAAGP